MPRANGLTSGAKTARLLLQTSQVAVPDARQAAKELLMRTRCFALMLAATIGVTSCASKTASTTSSGTGGAASPGGTSQPAAAQPSSGSAPQIAVLGPQDLDGWMKKVGATYASLNKNAGGDLKAASNDAEQLAELFGNVERFFAQHKKQDAVTWAQDARKHAAEAAGAAAANDQMKAQAAAKNMGGACKQCHGLYREGDQATGYRIKAGAIPGV